MPLPKQISPNPLLQTSLEVRFQSNLKTEEIISTFFPLFGKEFPYLKQNNLPAELRLDPQFAFSPHFVFSNDKYAIGIAGNSISFDNVNGYHLWENYFPIIKENLIKLNSLNLIKSINRVGLRYINIFNNHSEIHKLLNYNPGFNYEGYKHEVQISNTLYYKDDIKIVLQIAPRALAQKINSTETRGGMYIDIDCSLNKFTQNIFDENIFKVIQDLHTEEKKMFYSLLKDDFLKSLNPIY